MNRTTYTRLYPPPTDPRQLGAYMTRLRAMTAGEVEWSAPPEVAAEHDGKTVKSQFWHEANPSRVKLAKGGKHADRKVPFAKRAYHNSTEEPEPWRNTVRGLEEEE